MPYSGEIAANFATSTLKGGAGGSGQPLNPADTSLLLATGDGAKFPQPANGTTFRLMVGTNDVMKVTGRSGDTLTLVRAASLPTSDPDYNAATPTTWPVGTTVQEVYSAASAVDPWTAINTGRVFNVKDNTYGAVGDGATDDRVAIQAALNAAHSAGGGCVYLPAATYLVSTTTNPTDNTFSGALFIYSNTTLRGDGPGVTIIKLAATAANQAAVVQNAHISATGGNDTTICIQDLTINGNANGVAGLGAVDRNRGIHIAFVRDLRVVNVVSKNCYGTAGSPNGPHGTPAEGHHIVCYQSSEVEYLNCVVYSDDGGSTASGIAVGDCEAARILGCVAHDMLTGWGFTFYDCSGLSLVDCNSYKNAEGFFFEICTDVVATGCTAGGTAPGQAAAYPFTTGQTLGMTTASTGGFSSRGTVNLRMVGCTSDHNQQGLLLQNESSPARNQANTVIQGCRFSNNASVGAYCNNVNDVIFIGCVADSNSNSGFYVDTIAAGRIVFEGCISRSNTNYGYEGHGNTSQYLLLRDCQASGNSVNDVLAGATGSTIYGNVTAPAVPASPAAYTNVYPTPLRVYVNGGTVSNIQITKVGGAATSTGAISGAFDLKPGDIITVTYSVAPTWTFWAL